MASFDWKSLVGTVAPTIAGTFGTPLMGLGVKALCDALGMTPAAKEEDTHAALDARLATASPADLLAIKNSEQQFQKDMTSLGIDLERIQAADRDSARKMQTDTRSRIPAYMAILITVGFFGVLLGLMAGWLHTGDSNELLILLGALAASWGSVVNFYFGSSSQSHMQTRILGEKK